MEDESQRIKKNPSWYLSLPFHLLKQSTTYCFAREKIARTCFWVSSSSFFFALLFEAKNISFWRPKKGLYIGWMGGVGARNKYLAYAKQSPNSQNRFSQSCKAGKNKKNRQNYFFLYFVSMRFPPLLPHPNWNGPRPEEESPPLPTKSHQLHISQYVYFFPPLLTAVVRFQITLEVLPRPHPTTNFATL